MTTWFRMYGEFATDPVVQCLAFEDQRHFVILLCLKSTGLLDRAMEDHVREAVIRKALGLDAKCAADAKDRLRAVGIIDESWNPVHWDKRQFVSDSDPTHAERQRRYRERKALNTKDSDGSDSCVTRHRDYPEADTDTERASSPDGEESTRGVDVQPPPTSVGQTRKAPCPYGEIVDLYHAKLPMCRRVELLTDARKASIRGRWFDELPTVEAFGNYFDDVARSRFLTGRVDAHEGRKPFVANIDWLMKPSNLAKVLEGNYHDG